MMSLFRAACTAADSAQLAHTPSEHTHLARLRCSVNCARRTSVGGQHLRTLPLARAGCNTLGVLVIREAASS
jgi:hypothetical protein